MYLKLNPKSEQSRIVAGEKIFLHLSYTIFKGMMLFKTAMLEICPPCLKLLMHFYIVRHSQLTTIYRN